MDFKLRPWTPDDLDRLVAHANNWKIARFMADIFPHPYTHEDGRSFIALASSARPLQIMAIEVEGEAAGGIGIHPQADIYRKNAEMGYWLAEMHWGRGILTRTVLEMVDYGFRNFEIERIFARPFGTNIASQKVLQKAGFQLEAKLEKTFFKNGEYFDEHIYAIRRSNRK